MGVLWWVFAQPLSPTPRTSINVEICATSRGWAAVRVGASVSSGSVSGTPIASSAASPFSSAVSSVAGVHEAARTEAATRTLSIGRRMARSLDSCRT